MISLVISESKSLELETMPQIVCRFRKAKNQFNHTWMPINLEFVNALTANEIELLRKNDELLVIDENQKDTTFIKSKSVTINRNKKGAKLRLKFGRII